MSADTLRLRIVPFKLLWTFSVRSIHYVRLQINKQLSETQQINLHVSPLIQADVMNYVPTLHCISYIIDTNLSVPESRISQITLSG